MNGPDDELAGKVVKVLNRGVDNLDAATRERLAAARGFAMSRYRERPEAAWGLAWAFNAISPGGGHGQHGARYLIAGSVLVMALIGFGYWQATAPDNDVTEIDVNLLTDELPINAYLDQGFDSWLKRSSR